MDDNKEVQKSGDTEENKIIEFNQKGYVTLPFTEGEFKDFIVSLLGIVLFP